MGQTVGYSVRFDDQTSSQTRIKYMTDGMLFREILFDPLLQAYSVIMIDEAHERSLHTDIVLSLLKKITVKRRDLKIIVSSATIDAERFAEYFKVPAQTRTPGTVSGPTRPDEQPGLLAPAVISLDGTTFPLETFFVKGPVEDYVTASVQCVIEINEHVREDGDILVFLPGKSDIQRAIDELSDMLATQRLNSRYKLYPVTLHASLTTSEQLAALKPAPHGCRKVIFSTNIAETSITIDGVVFVVDSGLVKRKLYDPATGMYKLELENISKSSARQRAGRTGRTRPGKAYALYTFEAYRQFPDFSPSELQTTDVTLTVLQMKALGIDNILLFDLIDKPAKLNVMKAILNLRALGCVDGQGQLTPGIGVPLSELPVDPQMGKMIITSNEYGCSREIITIVAMMSVGDIFYSSIDNEIKRKQSVEEGDHLSYLNIYNSYITNKRNASNWCTRHSLNLKNLEKADRFRYQLETQLRHLNIPTVSSSSDPIQIQKCILSGLFMNLAQGQPDGTYRLIGRQFQTPLWMHPESVLFKRIPDWVVFGEAVETTKLFMKQVTSIRKEWILEVALHYYNGTHR